MLVKNITMFERKIAQKYILPQKGAHVEINLLMPPGRRIMLMMLL